MTQTSPIDESNNTEQNEIKVESNSTIPIATEVSVKVEELVSAEDSKVSSTSKNEAAVLTNVPVDATPVASMTSSAVKAPKAPVAPPVAPPIVPPIVPPTASPVAAPVAPSVAPSAAPSVTVPVAATIAATPSFTAAITSNTITSPHISLNTGVRNTTPPPLNIPHKSKRDNSNSANDPWTYAQLSFSDVQLKPRSADQPSESRDFVVGSIKGVDVSGLKYNDLRKICVRLRCPNYKNQNKEGMLHLITIAKMKHEGLIAHDYEGDVLLNGTTSMDPRTSGTRPTMSGLMTTQMHMGGVHDFSSSANALNGKRKRQDNPVLNSLSMKKMRQGDSIMGSLEHSKLEEEALLSATKLDDAKTCLVNFDRFSKISDRIRSLRATLKEEKDAESKNEIEEEITQLKAKKAELGSLI